MEISSKIHWESDNPLENTAEKVKLCWKMPLKIHDDFRGSGVQSFVPRPGVAARATLPRHKAGERARGLGARGKRGQDWRGL